MFDGTTNHPPRWTRSWIGFTRVYAFLAHVVPDMERIYLHGRVLLPRLPSDDDEGIVDLSGAAILTQLRIEKSAFTDASLTTVSDQESEQKGHTGAGQGRQYDDPSERLSSIIGTLNDRFGLNLTEADQLFFEQVEVEVAKNPRVQLVARNNDIDQFMTVFDGLLEDVIIDLQAANGGLLAAFLDKPDFRDTLTQMIGREFYKTIRASGKSA